MAQVVRRIAFGYTIDAFPGMLIVACHQLKRKLERAGQDPDLIVNVRGVGYRLSEPMVS